MSPSRLSRRLTTTLVILVALDAKDCRYHRADNSVIRAQCSLPVSPYTSRLPRVAPPGTYLGASTNTSKHARVPIYSHSRWGQHDVPLLHSNDVVLCGVPEAIVRLVSVSVCYRLVSGECCGARLRDVNRALSWCMSSPRPETLSGWWPPFTVFDRGESPEKIRTFHHGRRSRERSPADELSIIDKFRGRKKTFRIFSIFLINERLNISLFEKKT